MCTVKEVKEEIENLKIYLNTLIRLKNGDLLDPLVLEASQMLDTALGKYADLTNNTSQE